MKIVTEEDVKMVAGTPQPEQQLIAGEQKVPMILLEILVFGYAKDRPKLKELTEQLQQQFEKCIRRSKSRVRVFWYIQEPPIDGAPEKTIEEIKQWMIENTHCKYYVFANDGKTFTIPTDFMRTRLQSIKNLEDSIKKMKTFGIQVAKKISLQEG